MSAEELVRYCLNNDIQLFVENGNLKARGDENGIHELTSTLKESKAELIHYLEYVNKRPSEHYREEPLSRYFMAEGWSYEAAIELAKGIIERGSYLPAHEQVKYQAQVEVS